MPLVIQLTDDEKSLWKGLEFNEARRLAREVRSHRRGQGVAGRGEGWSVRAWRVGVGRLHRVRQQSHST